MYLVSACLLGIPCRYDGKAKPCSEVIAFLQDKQYKAICPECLGGLTIPIHQQKFVAATVKMF